MAELESTPDFDAARMFLDQASAANEIGDAKTCLAALKLVAVALGLSEGPNGKLHTSHLAKL